MKYPKMFSNPEPCEVYSHACNVTYYDELRELFDKELEKRFKKNKEREHNEYMDFLFLSRNIQKFYSYIQNLQAKELNEIFKYARTHNDFEMNEITSENTEEEE